jgi:YD repeat-containing protein
MATRKKTTTEPKVVKGSHLTVTTHPDGRTELEWDDEALLRDVRAAILKAESTIPAAAKIKKVAAKTKTAVEKKKPAAITAKPKAKPKKEKK